MDWSEEFPFLGSDVHPYNDCVLLRAAGSKDDRKEGLECVIFEDLCNSSKYMTKI